MKRKGLLGLLCIFLLTGCINTPVKDVFVTPVIPDVETTSFLYTPGTYSGVAQGKDGPIEVEVMVNESEIQHIEITRTFETDYEIVEEVPIETETPSEGENTEEENTENQESSETPSETPSEETNTEGTETETPEEEGAETQEPAVETKTTIINVTAVMDSIINEVMANQTLEVDPRIYAGAEPTALALLEAIRLALDQATLQ